MSKKKLKDTKVGKFLKGAGSSIIDSLGDVLPDNGVFGVVKNLISKDETLPQEDKEKALALLNQDTIEMQEVSKRWSSDMQSDSWLSKNTRPMALIFLTISLPSFVKILNIFLLVSNVIFGFPQSIHSLTDPGVKTAPLFIMERIPSFSKNSSP